MSAASVTARGRRAAEAQMLDSCTVSEPDGTTTVDPATDADVPALTLLYTSQCKVQPLGAGEGYSEFEAGAHTGTEIQARIDLPISSDLAPIGAVVEITAVGPATDPALLGQKFELIAAPIGSLKTAHRWPVRRYVA